MVKVNDRVYHVFNMGLKGTVERVEHEAAKTWLAAGPAHGQVFAFVRLADGKVVRLPAADLMRDD